MGDGERQIESIEDEPGSVSSSVSQNTEILPTENSAVSPSKPSATQNYLPSPHRGTPEESVEVVEVVDVDTELEGQQMKANELAKKEAGVAFNVRRRQRKLFAECNVCLSEVAVGKASQDLSLLKLHITTSKHKLNVAIAQSRSSEIPRETQELRNRIQGKFSAFKGRRFCVAPAIRRSLFLSDPFSSI